MSGTIIKGIGGFYYVDTDDGVYECRARGKFRKEKVTPTVGDFAEISVLDKIKKKGSLDAILPRKNELIRPKVANVDQALIIFAAVSPQFNPDLLDRFLILAEEQRLDITICINKIDLDTEERYRIFEDIYAKAGYRVIPVSAEKNINIDRLKRCVEGKISVVAGPSGAGKSSLINCLNPKFSLETGEISRKIERGKHTTRHAELMEIFAGSFIVDSPGFTSLYLNNINPEELKSYFPEFRPFYGQCRFASCRHINEPDCCVKEHVGAEISSMRYERYKILYDEICEIYEERKRQ
ncbi:ribosome small subunit-dependent GTPase A [Lachnospiraceae bacterium NSJ-143]|nr:ribosome small subunit-dependent GTPase A [Lachnospiraceae bacterium NSJ-143]